MPDPEALNWLVAADPNRWREWRDTKGPNVLIDLAGVEFDHLDLTAYNLSGTVDFSGSQLPGVTLRNATLTEATFDECNLSDAILSRATLTATRLSHADLTRAFVDGVMAERAVLNFATLRGATLAGANLTDASLIGADLRDADLTRAAQFGRADLTGADLRAAKVSANTFFRDAIVDKMKMDRFALETLADYGGLTRGQRMTMVISDPVATMRSYYSGFWQWIHAVALTLFVFPYATFMLRKYLVAGFDDAGSNTVTLWEALKWYVWTGGGAQGPSVSFWLFAFGLVYNVLRAILLFKTKSLELQELSSGLPARFSLAGWWGKALAAANTLFFVNLCIVGFHTWHFLQMRVPR